MATHIDGVLRRARVQAVKPPRKPHPTGAPEVAGTQFRSRTVRASENRSITLARARRETPKLRLSLENVILVDCHQKIGFVCLPWA